MSKKTFIVGIDTDKKDFNDWLTEHDKQIKAEVIDECIKAINDLKIEYAYPHTICNVLELLKEREEI